MKRKNASKITEESIYMASQGKHAAPYTLFPVHSSIMFTMN